MLTFWWKFPLVWSCCVYYLVVKVKRLTQQSLTYILLSTITCTTTIKLYSLGSHLFSHLCDSCTGPLEPVDDLNIEKDCARKSMNVFWTRPYTLDGLLIPGYKICVDENCQNYTGDIESASVPFPDITVSFSEKYVMCIQVIDNTTDDFTNDSCINITLNEGMQYSIDY